MARTKRKKPYNPRRCTTGDRMTCRATRRWRRSRSTIPLDWSPATRSSRLRSIRNDPSGAAAHASSDRRGAVSGRPGLSERLGKSRARTARGRPDARICRWRTGARADHGRPAQGGAAAQPRRTRTGRGWIGAGARGVDPRHDHGADRSSGVDLRGQRWNDYFARRFRECLDRLALIYGFSRRAARIHVRTARR